jgi:6-phosphofructokinase
MKNILIAHGGGPTAVINSSLQGIIEAAHESGQVGRIYAARHGVEGILKGDLIDLTDVPAETVRRLAYTPASAIGSCRRKLGETDYPVILQCLKKHEIDCFFYNGGNDSMDTCQKIHAMALREGLDLRVIGIPKTMDNDLAVTDHCPGFGSAARYAAVNAAELALDAAALPIHVIVLELMGRNAGWVTAASAWASRATHCEQLVCLPEQPVDEKKLLAAAERRFAKGKGLLICVSEGVCGMDGKPLASTGIVDGFGHTVAGGTAQYLADRLMQELGVKARAEKPGLLGRTSIPYASAVDRREAYEVGSYGLKVALRGESGSMVAIRADRSGAYRSELFLTPLTNVANVEKCFPQEWITEDFGISDAFFDYAAPLMDELPRQYAFL